MPNNWKIVNGTYGSAYTPCSVFVYNCWYAVEGSVNVNCTYDDIESGVDVEILNDVDMFTASRPIEDIDDLIRKVDEYVG